MAGRTAGARTLKGDPTSSPSSESMKAPSLNRRRRRVAGTGPGGFPLDSSMPKEKRKVVMHTVDREQLIDAPHGDRRGGGL